MKIFMPLREDSGGFVTAVQYYRAVLPLMTLKEHNKSYEVHPMSSKQVATMSNLHSSLRDGILGNFDIYWLSRLQRKSGIDIFMDEVHSLGGKVIFDTDDDLSDEYRDVGVGRDFLSTIKAVDAVTVSTPYLAARMEKYTGYKPAVLQNNISTSWFSESSMKSERLSDKLTVGFIGTSSHYNDWIIAEPAIRKLAQTHDIQIVTAGYCPDYLEDIPDIEILGGVSYPYYPGLVRQLDIVCCVLDKDDTFNHSKSAVKALESMCAARVLSNGKVGGAVPVCTDMKVYRRVVDKQNGMLVDNADWYQALKELVENESMRNRLASRGYTWVKKHRDINDNYREWARVLKRVYKGD